MKSRVFEIGTATEAEFHAVNDFNGFIRAEVVPDDPPRSLEYTIDYLRSLEAIENHVFEFRFIWQGGTIIAELLTDVGYEDSNRHLMGVELIIHPEYRRRGLATALLHDIVQVAAAHGRDLVLSQTNDRIPAGAAFAQRVGATEAYKAHVNQLEFADLDRALLGDWVAGSRREEYELDLWTGAYPEEELESIANLMRVMNTAPTEDLDIEPTEYTPEMIRQWEAYAAGRKLERWTYYLRHRESGKLAGFTEVIWDPGNPETLDQRDTGVLPEHRGKGLGKWLKAQMLLKVIADRPSVKRVRTGNADANAPMLAINNRLGFRPFFAASAWQIGVDSLNDYLASE